MRPLDVRPTVRCKYPIGSAPRGSILSLQEPADAGTVRSAFDEPQCNVLAAFSKCFLRTTGVPQNSPSDSP